MSVSLQQLVVEHLKANLSEGYKDDPKKLRAMRQSNTRGTGLSADEVKASMVAEYKTKAIQALVVSKFNAKKIQSIMKSKIESVADKMDLDIPVEITHAAKAVKFPESGMEEFGLIAVNIAGSIDQDEDFAFEMGPIMLSLDGVVLNAQLAVHMPASMDLDVFKIAQVFMEDYDSPVKAINALAAKSMEALTDDAIYKKAITWIHRG